MSTKVTSTRVKAGPAAGLPEGTFTAYASVWDTVDSYGERVVAGAFADTLAWWDAKGKPIPLLFGHNMADPDFNIGYLASAVEDDHGLLVEGVLDLDNPKAAQVYRMLKGGRVDQLSFAYDVVDSRVAPLGDADGPKTGRKQPAEVKELTALKLYEVSIVTIGANQDTEVLSVKAVTEAMLAKAGRMLSARNEQTLRDVLAQLQAATGAVQNVLSQLGDGEEKSTNPGGTAQGQTSGTPTVTRTASEEAGGARNSTAGSGDPKASPSVADLVAKLRFAELARKG